MGALVRMMPGNKRWPALPISLLVLLVTWLAGCSVGDDHTPHRTSSLNVQNYPGSVLWYNPANDTQRAPGRSVSIGREAFSLPQYQVAYHEADSYLATAPVGEGHCLNGDSPLSLVPLDSDALPPDEPLSRLSVAFWAKWQGNDQPLLSLGTNAWVPLFIRVRDRRVELAQQGRDGQSSRVTSRQLEPGQWHHLAMTLNRIGSPESERGLVLHVNAEKQSADLALPFVLEQLQFRFHEPSSTDGLTCFSDIVVLLDPIATSTVADLYELSGRQAGGVSFWNDTDLPNEESGTTMMHQH